MFFPYANYTRTADQNVTSTTSTQRSTGQLALHKQFLALPIRYLHQIMALFFLPPSHGLVAFFLARATPPAERSPCIKYNGKMYFIPAFSEPQAHWPRDPPPPDLGQSGREARAKGVVPRGNHAVSPHRFSRFSEYRLIVLINRVLVGSTCRIQRILSKQQKPTAKQRRSVARSKEGTHDTTSAPIRNTTPAPTRHPIPVHRLKIISAAADQRVSVI